MSARSVRSTLTLMPVLVLALVPVPVPVPVLVMALVLVLELVPVLPMTLAPGFPAMLGRPAMHTVVRGEPPGTTAPGPVVQR